MDEAGIEICAVTEEFEGVPDGQVHCERVYLSIEVRVRAGTVGVRALAVWTGRYLGNEILKEVEVVSCAVQ